MCALRLLANKLKPIVPDSPPFCAVGLGSNGWGKRSLCLPREFLGHATRWAGGQAGACVAFERPRSLRPSGEGLFRSTDRKPLTTLLASV